MSCAALYVGIMCGNSIIECEPAPPLAQGAVGVMVGTISLKAMMWLAYSWLNHPITLTLAEDHRNDVVTNTFGLFMYWGGTYMKWWMDALGGLLISAWVVLSWGQTVYRTAFQLVGKSSPPSLVRSVTFVSMGYDGVRNVSKVAAWCLGEAQYCDVVVETDADIALPAAIALEDGLARRLEAIDGVARAWVKVSVGIDRH
jgi:divalent metal cation (Fe/Co/Zn/Cd) transporter